MGSRALVEGLRTKSKGRMGVFFLVLLLFLVMEFKPFRVNDRPPAVLPVELKEVPSTACADFETRDVLDEIFRVFGLLDEALLVDLTERNLLRVVVAVLTRDDVFVACLLPEAIEATNRRLIVAWFLNMASFSLPSYYYSYL